MCNIRTGKIVHLALTGPFTDQWSYQENLLPKYHKKLGYDVTIIASENEYDDNGQERKTTKSGYINCDGVKIIRLPAKLTLLSRLCIFKGLYQTLEDEQPDILFIHNFQMLDTLTVVRYLKQHHVKTFIDNHADYANSARGFLSRQILHRFVWRYIGNRISDYTTCFYGVLPARVDFLVENYKLPCDKCKLLVMGVDDEAVAQINTDSTRKILRASWGVTENDIVIATGGKIDTNKPQTIDLMRAVNENADLRVKLIVFGSVIPELKDEFDNQISEKVKYIGWKKANEIYEVYAGADIVAFPGLHSVMWEQAVGMGKPCIFKRIEGFDHIDLDGNCLFFESDSVLEYKQKITESVSRLTELRSEAERKGPQRFSYMSIAKKSLEG